MSYGVNGLRVINVNSYITKKQVTDVLDRNAVHYRPGKAPRGDSLEQLKQTLRNWLVAHGAAHGVITNRTLVEELCRRHGHPKPLMTPPYHPELQPIEELWRDVKMYVARLYGRTRTMKDLTRQVQDGFLKYGTQEATHGKIKRMLGFEELYLTQGCYNVPAPNFDTIDLTDEDDREDIDIGEGNVEEEVWNVDDGGDVNNEMDDEDELDGADDV